MVLTETSPLFIQEGEEEERGEALLQTLLLGRGHAGGSSTVRRTLNGDYQGHQAA